MGDEPTAPSTRRASSTTPSETLTAAATPRIGKSNEPRRRSFSYIMRQPSEAGNSIEERISSGRRVRYRMPSSRKKSPAETVRSPLALTSFNAARKATATGAVSELETAQQRGLFGATQQIAPSFFMQKSMLLRQWSF